MANSLVNQKLDEKNLSNKVYENYGNPELLSWVSSGSRTVLDVGCGAGDNARLLKHRGNIVDGITLSEHEAHIAQPYMRKVYVHNLESGLPDATLDGSYDYALCSHVIEHICYPDKLLADIRRCLKPGGQLIVALPNLLYYKYRVRLVLGHFEYENSGIMDNTHFRWYTFATAKRLLADSGFVQIHTYADKWACKISPGLFGYQLVLIYLNPC
jgi:2-polyprenyl-3-methyl-5-hydroxy-6-metoxy-1,4-benzoquinol methylase